MESVEKLLGNQPAIGWTSNPTEAFLSPLDLSPKERRDLVAAIRRLGLRLPILGGQDFYRSDPEGT